MHAPAQAGPTQGRDSRGPAPALALALKALKALKADCKAARKAAPKVALKVALKAGPASDRQGQGP